MSSAPAVVNDTGILNTIAYGAGKLFTCLVVFTFFRARYYGQNNIPESGGGLIVSNHQSFLDPPLLGGGSTRRLRYLARDTLFTNPLFGAVLRTVGAIPVRRGTSDKDAIRQSIEILKQGHLLVMFPEGTRTSDGNIKPFKGGFRLLASRANAPIIPAAVHGMYESWPRTKLIPRPRQVRVMYGKPITPDEYLSMSEEEIAEKIHKEITSLLEKLRGLA